MTLLDRWLHKIGSIHIKCSMTGQDKGDILIQVTAWTGLYIDIHVHIYIMTSERG